MSGVQIAQNLSGKRILLIVGGGVAAYKSLDLVRRPRERGAGVRVVMTAFPGITGQWQQIVVFIAIASMALGAFAAIGQRNIKRQLAYSSIANVGFMLIGLAAGTRIGASAVLFYLAVYAVMNFGAFAVVALLEGSELSDFHGLAKRQPVTAGLMAVFLASLIGLPLTAGFFGKFYIFKSAIDAELYWLAGLGLLTSAVAAFYYLRIIVVIFLFLGGSIHVSL